DIAERGVWRVSENVIGRRVERPGQERIDRRANEQAQRRDRGQLLQWFRNRNLALNFGEDLEGLDVDVVARISPARVQIGGDNLVEAQAWSATFHFKLLRQTLGEIFVKQLRFSLDLDLQEVATDDWNHHAFGNGLEQLAPLFRIVVHGGPRLSGTRTIRNSVL